MTLQLDLDGCRRLEEEQKQREAALPDPPLCLCRFLFVPPQPSRECDRATFFCEDCENDNQEEIR